jgi:hypothetical protein
MTFFINNNKLSYNRVDNNALNSTPQRSQTVIIELITYFRSLSLSVSLSLSLNHGPALRMMDVQAINISMFLSYGDSTMEHLMSFFSLVQPTKLRL